MARGHSVQLARVRSVLLVFGAIGLLSPQLVSGSAGADPGPRLRLAPAAGADVIEGQYIVRFTAGTDPMAKATSIESGGADVSQSFRNIFRGAVVQASPAELDALLDDPQVAAIEPDVRTHVEESDPPLGTSTAQAVQSSPPWGLDRIDQRSRPLSSSYSYGSTAAGVTAYIVDTGIRANHVDFGGRVASGYDAVGGGTADCNGHGTHVAGTVGGSTYGVAKGVSLVPVRVLDCAGNGTSSEYLAGLDWVVGHHAQSVPAVVNISLGFDAPSSAVDAATQALINDGVSVIVAAGNEAVLACGQSPARVGPALTVAASDSADREPLFSNYGSCVDLYAPGVDIRSASHTSTTGSRLETGTSMSSPHVAGAAALVLSAHPAWTPAQVAAHVLGNATTNAIVNASTGTANRLLYVPQSVATAPANDNFADAAPLVLSGSGAVSGTNIGASKQPNEPDHAGVPGGASIWWKFTAGSSGSVTFSTDGSTFDTVLAAYTGNTVGGLTEVASNDDRGDGVASSITFTVAAGATYRLAVDGYEARTGGVTLNVSGGGPPANDAFAQATTFALSGPGPLSGSNRNATLEAGEPVPADGSGGASVWWRFSTVTAQRVVLSTEGSDFDTTLGAYTGTSVGALDEIAANDDARSDGTSEVAFTTAAGTTYSVAVAGYGPETGSITLSFANDGVPVGPAGTLYVPMTPCRVLDTRSGSAMVPGETRSIQVAGTGAGFAGQGGRPGGCGVPDGAAAVEASVTAVGPSANGFFRAWPAGVAQPTATFLNYSRAQSTTNTGAIALAGTGTEDLAVANSGGSADYVIDVQGYFVVPAWAPSGAGSVYVAITPCRVVDSRAGAPLSPGEQRSFQVGGSGSTFAGQGGRPGGCGVPDGASAVEASVTAVGPAANGFFRAWPAGVAQPNATFLNYSRGQSTTNTGSIALAASGTKDLSTLNSGAVADYVIDVQGYFVTSTSVAAGSGSVYVPASPCRVVDTRSGSPLVSGAQRAFRVGGTGAEFVGQGGRPGGCSVPDGASAVEASVTAVGPSANGFFRAWPAGVAQPNATFLNYSRGQSTTNTGAIALAPAGTNDLATANQGATAHYVVDIQGFYRHR